MFTSLLEKLERTKPGVVCVEAAHIYTNETPSDDHFFCARIGARVVEALAGNGARVVKMLFVDDYHPKPEEAALNLPAYMSELERAGFAPDMVITESSLAESARSLVYSLNGQTIQRDGEICLAKPNLALIAKNGALSCNILDAALYLEKFRKFDFSITVLPEIYKAQQKNVRKLLKAFGHETVPIANVYYNVQGKIKLSFWTKQEEYNEVTV